MPLPSISPGMGSVARPGRMRHGRERAEGFGKPVWPVADGAEEMPDGGVGRQSRVRKVDIQKLAVSLAEASGDLHGIYVGPIGGMHDGPGRVVGAHQADIGGVDEDEVGLLADRRAAGLVIQ